MKFILLDLFKFNQLIKMILIQSTWSCIDKSNTYFYQSRKQTKSPKPIKSGKSQDHLILRRLYNWKWNSKRIQIFLVTSLFSLKNIVRTVIISKDAQTEKFQILKDMDFSDKSIMMDQYLKESTTTGSLVKVDLSINMEKSHIK